MWGSIHGKDMDDIKNKCINLNPHDKKWTEVCLMAVSEYFESEKEKTKEISSWIKIITYRNEKN